MTHENGYMCFSDHIRRVRAHISDSIRLGQHEALGRIAYELEVEADRARAAVPETNFEVWKVDVFNGYAPMQSATYPHNYTEEEAKSIVEKNSDDRVNFGRVEMLYFARKVG